MTAALVKQPIEWVDTEDALIHWCEQWQHKKLLAVDTEFMRSQTYYPIAALIQVNDGATNVLIDPTKISDMSFLSEILSDENIIKVLHSCSEDLEVFQRALGVIPQGLFDTQLAGAALGYGFSVGYANMVNAALGVELPKSETRSDWLQRPLSQAQIIYAAIDVEYLYTLASQFMAALEQKNRLHWIEEECRSVLASFSEAQTPETSYQRVKSAWKLNARQLACLMELCSWREKKAQFRDVPRNRVIKENALFQLALRAPKQASQLKNYEGVTERMIRADGADILTIIEQAQKLPEAQLPPVLPRPLGGGDTQKIKLLREKVVEYAEHIGVAPELLVKKREYEYLTRFPQQIPPGLEGWRKPVIGEKLLGWMQELAAMENVSNSSDSAGDTD